MKKLALFAFAAGAAVSMSSMASAQYYEQPRHYQQHYQPSCPHGYHYRHGRCVEIVVRQHCQDGYAYRDGYCQPVYRKRYNSY